MTRSFDVFFDLRLNKRLSKQYWGWWFETQPCPLWRHNNGMKWMVCQALGALVVITHLAGTCLLPKTNQYFEWNTVRIRTWGEPDKMWHTKASIWVLHPMILDYIVPCLYFQARMPSGNLCNLLPGVYKMLSSAHWRLRDMEDILRSNLHMHILEIILCILIQISEQSAARKISQHWTR